MIFGQIFGLLPIQGILSNHINDLRFKFLSIRVAYTLIIHCICIFEFIMFFYHLPSMGYNFGAIGDLFYYLFAIFTTLYLTIFASKWIILMKTWCENENIFYHPPPTTEQSDFKFFTKKIRIFAVCFIGFLIGESQVE